MDGGGGVDPVAVSVDGDVVVVPAEGYQVVGIMVAAVGPLLDVVGLEPVAAVASFDRTLVLVPLLHETSNSGRNGLAHVRICHRVEAVGGDDPDLAGAENL